MNYFVDPKGVLKRLLILIVGVNFIMLSSNAHAGSIVSVTQGKLQGDFDKSKQVFTFKGIPYAAPPLDELRWKAPQAPASWENIRSASAFGNQCMQLPLFDDMTFRSAGISEDCLYLNVWTTAIKPTKPMPVLLYFYGGGFAAGDGSEPRYDGASMAQKDIVVITANYRLGIFGLLSLPELSKENVYSASGNYTFMDQAAALQWAVDNVASFGGDPTRITIAGESAGSMSVNALMVSPLSRHNIAGAIGESGSLLGPTLGAVSLAEAQDNGTKMALALGADGIPLSLDQLRKVPAQELLDLSTEAGFQWFMPTVDGYVFPQSPLSLYTNKQFAKIPLLAGNNSQEGSYQEVLGDRSVTVRSYTKALASLYPEYSEVIYELYPATTHDEIKDAAQALASDRFISFSTWNWVDLVAKVMPDDVYYYEFSKVRPVSVDLPIGQISESRGAVHSAEIEYALGNLTTHPAYQWQSQDFVVSSLMQHYFANFIKTGNPNNTELPDWPLFSENKQINIAVEPYVQDITHLHERYQFHRVFYDIK
jgi:para-nitrobenzyl esterase